MTKTQKMIIGFLALTSLALVVFVVSQTRLKENSRVFGADSGKGVTGGSQQGSGAGRLVKIAAEGIEPERVPKVSFPADKHCEVQWEKVTAMSVAGLAEELSSGKWKLSDSCQRFEKIWYLNFPLDVYYRCKKSSEAHDKQDCFNVTSLYRANVIDGLTRSEFDFSGMDLRVLVNKFIARVTRGASSPSDREALIGIAVALTERVADAPGSWKALAEALLVSERTSDPRFQDAIDKAIILNPGDMEMVELSLMQASRSGKDGLRKIEEYVLAHSQMPEAYYHLAGSMWKAGERDKAISALEKALSLRPEDPRIKGVLERARQTQDTNTKIFVIGFKIPFENL